MTEAKSNKVKTGVRSKAEDDAALAAIVAEAKANGKSVVDEDGGTFIVEDGQFGLTIKTRIA